MILENLSNDDNNNKNIEKKIEILKITNNNFIDLETLYQAFLIIKNKWIDSDN